LTVARAAAQRPRKKVLHLCAVGFSAKTLLLPQIDRLRARELDVDLAFSPDDTVDELRARGYTVHPVAIDRRIAPASNLRSIGRLAALMRANAYDLVHVHSPIASVLGRIAARRARVARVGDTPHGV